AEPIQAMSGLIADAGHRHQPGIKTPEHADNIICAVRIEQKNSLVLAGYASKQSSQPARPDVEILDGHPVGGVMRINYRVENFVRRISRSFAKNINERRGACTALKEPVVLMGHGTPRSIIPRKLAGAQTWHPNCEQELSFSWPLPRRKG